MIVAWQFDETAGGWLLTHDVQQQMDEFESCIFDACDNEKWWGAGVALVTLPGVREWQFYTPDPQLFMHEFCRVLSDKKPYPLKFSSALDPEWKALRELQSAKQ